MVSMTNWPRFSEGDDPDKYEREVARVIKRAQSIRDSLHKDTSEKSPSEIEFLKRMEIIRVRNAERAKEIYTDDKDESATSNEI